MMAVLALSCIKEIRCVFCRFRCIVVRNLYLSIGQVTSLLCFLASVADTATAISSTGAATAPCGDGARGESLAARVAQGVSARAGPSGAVLWRLPPRAMAHVVRRFPADSLRLAQVTTLI